LPTLQIIIASVREGRVGGAVSEWFIARAREHGGFEIDVVDLTEIDLPLFDEPNHPRLRQYTHEYTHAWSARVDAADAFAFVTPEYNHGPSPALINAIAYLHHEWRYKPACFVSYGGVSAGLRAVQVVKQILSALNVMTISEAVSIPFVQQFLDDERRIQPNEIMINAATAMLDTLVRVESALRVLREGG
jgi:NAD(P)H-dependent FMN reductase